jgi:DNA (cytosine-5)-methyltransferase 1
MTHGSLFSGIGGFDLAAEWMGWSNVFHCEWMPFPRQILKHYWPDAKSYEDITKTDFSIHRGTIDILTGGFPCQPYSTAGKRLGKNDTRHLWPEMLRAIHEIKPTYIVGENVRGLINWDGGLVFEEVCTDLENCGYEVQPVLLSAAGVGAPHRRERCWFVAYSNSNGQHRCNSEYEINTSEGRFNAFNDTEQTISSQPTSHTKSKRLESVSKPGETSGTERFMEGERNKFAGKFAASDIKQYWESFPTQSPICGGDDGIPSQLDGITFSKWRQESIKGYGNAIVPQVAYLIFKAILETEFKLTDSSLRRKG